jgi:hypothetical protein
MNNQGHAAKLRQTRLLQRSLPGQNSWAPDQVLTYQTCRPQFLCRRSIVARRLEHSRWLEGQPGSSTSVRFMTSSREQSPSIRSRFPYMFEGDHDGLTLFRGWSPILAKACEKIDQIVLESSLAFHWVLLQEENAAGRFMYALGWRPRYFVDLSGCSRRALVHPNRKALASIARRIDAVVWEAERLTSEACIVCGVRCEHKHYFGRELPLCKAHQPEHLNEFGEEGLQGVWRSSVEWEAP